MIQSILASPITQIILGALITGLVSKYYYQKATKDLKKEAIELRKLNILILEGLENGGLVTLARDEKGNILGYNFLKLRLSEPVNVSEKAIVQVKPEKPE